MKEFFNDVINIDEKNASTKALENELTRLIEVTPPYYALRNLQFDAEGYLQANVDIEMTDHGEVPCLSLSETGRHVAILGSLALANENPVKEKHYYLACDAVFDRLHNNPVANETLTLRAKVVSINKREGFVQGQLLASNGELVYEAQVRYVIIHHIIFSRKFAKNLLAPDPHFNGNPYANATPLRTVSQNPECHIGYIDVIDRNDCVGHFINYPALPVARISGAMFALSGNHFKQLLGLNRHYSIRRVEMHAESFIFAGEQVKITTQVEIDTKVEGTLVEAYAYASSNIESKAVVTKCWFC